MSLERWREPAGYSLPGGRAALFENLPRGPQALAGVVQGLLMHEHISPAYGLALSADQHAQAHVRSVEGMLDGIAGHDARPLTAARAPGERQVGVCRHFTLMHVAMLRDQGVPARARCGFAAYFEKTKVLDHWVTEYWNGLESRWILVDSQLDQRQCDLFQVAFDPCDVPRDQFLVAGEAWRRCRRGEADPGAFGILDMYGYWFIAGNVIRDVAALNNREMLPWDMWGGMTTKEDEVDHAFIDELSAMTLEPDAHLEALSAIYTDERVAVPGTVFNHVRFRPEQL